MWACLSRRQFQYLDWGARSATLETILTENDGTPFPLMLKNGLDPIAGLE